MRDEYEKQLLANFDVLRWLDERTPLGPYTKSSTGWASMRCPNPLCLDGGNHFNICFQGEVYFHCWKCKDDPDGMKGDGIWLVQKIMGVSEPVARNYLERYQFDDSVVRIVEDRNRDYGPCRLPVEAIPVEAGEEPSQVVAWFKYRRRECKVPGGYPLSLCQKYRLSFSEFGSYPLRLFIPMYLNGVMVSWQGKDVTETKGVAKYLSNKPEVDGGMSIGNVLYGIDDVKDKPFVIIVEGPTDKWMLGDCAVALMGKALGPARRALLYETVGADRPIFLLLDANVPQIQVDRKKRALQDLFNYVGLVKYDPESDGEDPGKFSQETVKEILKQLEALCTEIRGNPKRDQENSELLVPPPKKSRLGGKGK